jgi:hypothetical protein
LDTGLKKTPELANTMPSKVTRQVIPYHFISFIVAERKEIKRRQLKKPQGLQGQQHSEQSSQKVSEPLHPGINDYTQQQSAPQQRQGGQQESNTSARDVNPQAQQQWITEQ